MKEGKQMGSSPMTLKSFLGYKTALVSIIAIFLAGVGSVVGVTKYLDERASDKFYEKTSGQLLEQRVHIVEESFKEQKVTMDTIYQQQISILIEIGKINAKLDK